MPGAYRPGAAQSDDTDRPRLERSFQDVYQILLDRGLSEDAAGRLLRDYPSDKRFDQAEIDAILRRVRPEDLLTRRTKEQKEPDEELTLLPQRTGGPLEPEAFGYDVFARAPESFEPDQDLAVGSDYRLGPGDELRITLWGSIQQEFFGLVDREGNLALPEMGLVPAAGATLGEMERRLEAELRKTFSGFKLSVTLRRLRRIQVIVAGDVKRPGAYFLSPVSSVFNALYYAGGPTAQGTLRRIRVVRDGRLIAEVDLYPTLLLGEASDEVKLVSGDTVFILPKGAEATVRGEVSRPAIFELAGSETVADLVAMAGGFTPTTHPDRATLDRVSPATGPISIDVDLSDLLVQEDVPPASPTRLPLQDGDDLTVYSIYHVAPREFVEIQGMVQYPGIYPLYPGTRISDLVFRAGGLLDSAYRLTAELSRLAPPGDVQTREGVADSVSRVHYIELDKALGDPSSTENRVLSKDDKLYIRKIPGWKTQETVKVTGEVVFPGIYPLLVREERLSHVIERAGGLTKESFLMGASLFREEQGRVIISFENALKKEREDIVLVDGDSIHVPSYPPTILVEGQVSRPGALLFKSGKNADYYVERTGGPDEKADRGRTRIIRVDGVVQKAFRRFWWDPEVQPGSRIVVAEKVPGEGVDWGTAIKDATTILASLATTVFIVTQINK